MISLSRVGGPESSTDPFHVPTWVPETWSPPPANGRSSDDDSTSPPAHVTRLAEPLARARLPAQLLRIVRRRRFILGTTPDAERTTIPLTGVLDVAGWTRGLLVVRVHEVFSMPAGSPLLVVVRRVEWSPDEPEQIFTSGVIAQAEVLAMGLQLGDFSGILTPRLRVELVSPAASIVGVRDVAISIDLLGRFGGS